MKPISNMFDKLWKDHIKAMNGFINGPSPDFLFENSPEKYEAEKKTMIRSSKLYQAPKEESTTSIIDDPWETK